MTPSPELTSKSPHRAAIVAGLRTPFARQTTAFRETSTLEMGRMVVNELLSRHGLKPKEVELLVFGQVLPMLNAPNIAREIVLGTAMSPETIAYSVSMQCASSLRAIVSVAEAISLGDISVGIAGGTDSASVVPIGISKTLSRALVDLSKARSLQDRLKILAKVRLPDLLPVPPEVKELSTGMTMGQHGEQMAKHWGITRAAQDELAHRSHTLASQAWKSGKLEAEVMTCYCPPKREPFSQDNVVRHDSSLEAYSKLKPVFDKAHGTLTAGNSTPLTDGASAVLLMQEEKARALGLEVLGVLRAYAFTALDPRHNMLLGPTHATPVALKRAGLTLKEMDLIDMHEAFSAQTLCNLKAFASDSYARDVLGLSEAIGEVDMDRFNVLGGSVAYGHPFAATGGRMVIQQLRELKRRNGKFGLVTLCAAGGLGAALILEVV